MSDGKLRALVEEMRTKAAMIELGEKIAWGSDWALLRKGADALESHLSASSNEGWRVKPLEWRQDSGKNQYPNREKAEMPCGGGFYTVAGSERLGEWLWYRNGYLTGANRKPMNIEAAKAAAQADYEARIRSAILPRPPSPGEEQTPQSMEQGR